MGITLLNERHADEIAGVLGCFDRVVIQGTLPGWCYALGMTRYVSAQGVRIFDYPLQFAKPLGDEIRQTAERLAAENDLKVDYVKKKNFRKEDRIKEVLEKRGDHPGLVWIFSALEPCTQYKPWHDKPSGRTFLKPEDGKCLHYYFYFIDEELGLCYLRVPTWCPFRLQFYCNGHSRLAMSLKRRGIGYGLMDNALVSIDDWEAAQKLSDDWEPARLHRKLDGLARRYCPFLVRLQLSYHWSLDQAEYATDMVFLRRADLQAIYEDLTRSAIQAVKADDIATFLGKKLRGNYLGEMGNRYNIRIEGTRVRHSMGPASIKVYDKFGHVLRIETTIRDVTFFRHYREVEQADGSRVCQQADMKKSIYSLGPLREVLAASNRRYLEFLSALEDHSAGTAKLTRLTRPVRTDSRSYAGFNFFNDQDQKLFEVLVRGEFFISGLQNRDLRQRLGGKTSAQVSRLLRRLRLHGLVRKAGAAYKYYLTALGKQVAALGLKLKTLVVIPELATA